MIFRAAMPAVLGRAIARMSSVILHNIYELYGCILYIVTVTDFSNFYFQILPYRICAVDIGGSINFLINVGYCIGVS